MPHTAHEENVASTGPRPIGEVLEEAFGRIEERHARPLVRLQETLSDGRIAVEVFDRTRASDEPTYDFYVRGPHDALQWIRQMGSKRWITAEHLSTFADLMMEAFPEGAGDSRG